MKIFQRNLAVLSMFLVLNVLLLVNEVSADVQPTQDGRSLLTIIDSITKQYQATQTCASSQIIRWSFDRTPWIKYTTIAIQTANLLTKLLASNTVTITIPFLLDLSRNDVQLGGLIYGSAVCFLPEVLGFRAPYGYRASNGKEINAVNILYDYTQPNQEWFYLLMNRTFENVSITTYAIDKSDSNTTYPVEHVSNPNVRYEDGAWTNPYFDCGGGNIWMVSYAAAILRMKNGVPTFCGVASVDLELTDIDLNQCPWNNLTSAGQTNDVFRGTAKCPNTTQCVQVIGFGFRAGGYNCECLPGYYWEGSKKNNSVPFNGTYVESLTEDQIAKLSCTKCEPGCDTCVDDTQCLFYANNALRIPLLVVIALEMLMVLAACLLVQIYREKPIIKAANPPFLQIMNVGILISLVWVILIYLTPESDICIAIQWVGNFGFYLTYGAQFVLMWRLKTITTATKYRKPVISNNDMYIRLGGLLSFIVCYLIAYTASSKIRSVEKTTYSNLKFNTCLLNFWNYLFVASKIVFLIGLIYVCQKIRLLRGQFNVKKYLTWAAYNHIITGTFVYIIRELTLLSQGPDLWFGLTWLYVEISAMGPFLFIYIPKFININKVEDEVEAIGRSRSRHEVKKSETRLNVKPTVQVGDGKADDLKLTKSEGSIQAVD